MGTEPEAMPMSILKFGMIAVFISLGRKEAYLGAGEQDVEKEYCRLGLLCVRRRLGRHSVTPRVYQTIEFWRR